MRRHDEQDMDVNEFWDTVALLVGTGTAELTMTFGRDGAPDRLEIVAETPVGTLGAQAPTKRLLVQMLAEEIARRQAPARRGRPWWMLALILLLDFAAVLASAWGAHMVGFGFVLAALFVVIAPWVARELFPPEPPTGQRTWRRDTPDHVADEDRRPPPPPPGPPRGQPMVTTAYHGVTLQACPWADDKTIYGDCPAEVHGLAVAAHERCDACPARS